MGDGDVVEELGAAEDEFFFPGCGLAEELLRVVGEDSHNEFVKGFGHAGGTGVLACANDLGGFALGIEGASLQDDAFFAAAEDGGDVGVEANVDAL